MRRCIRTAAAFILLLAGPTGLVAGEASDRLVERGDRFYENRGKGAKWCVKALECYEKALAIEPENVTASWKYAQASYTLGVHTDGDEEKIAIFKKGIDIAKRAVSIDDKSVESHFWLGVSYGKYGEAKGVMNSLALVEPIKAEMAKVIELDEAFDGGGAHRVLGRLYHKLPGVAGGSTELALSHLKKAIEFSEARLLNHLFIAEVYIGEDDVANAKKHLKIVIDAPFEEGRRPENEEEKAAARELLSGLEGE